MPTTPPSPPHELLAPAGSIEAFFAAMEAGADAVYCGLKEFSARAKAKNFTLAEMERLTAFAHQERRRLYVTVNTLIKEAELPGLVETLAALASFRVDGLIIQDLGLWRLIRQHFPDLPLHASTQMAIHNAAGVKMLEAMGFCRAVLARELSLEEIAAIRRQTTIELEHFVHGALCYSISGHCLFSSYLTGQSGNRGRCAQPCRRRYRLQDKTGFYFSTSDLSAISLLPRLAEAGVMSFKIEGRMKNAEYVSTVVTAYRGVLDARPADRPQAIRQAEEILTEAFGRATTTGLLKGRAPAGIALPSTRGGIGRQLGRVEKVRGNSVSLTISDSVHVGDRLRIQPQSDLAGSAFTVQELFLGQRQVKRAESGSLVRIVTPFHGIFQAGDQAYKVATGKAFTLSEAACLRRLAAVTPPADEARLTIACQGASLTLEAEVAGCRLTKDYAVEMLPAAHSPLNRETLHRTFAKTGHAEIVLGRLTVKSLPPVVIKPSRLNEVRRDFYAALGQQVNDTRRQALHQRIAAVQASLLPARPAAPVDKPTLSLVAKGSRDLALLAEQSSAVERILLPLTPELVAQIARLDGRLRPEPGRLVWDIPAMIYEGEWRSYQMVIRQLRKTGVAAFRLNNLSHFRLFDDPEACRLSAGPWLYAINSQAALALAGLGARQFTLSLEDDQQNMTEVLARRPPGISPSVVVYSPLALLTSRIPMRGMRSGAVLTADNGEAIHLDFTSGLTVALAGQDFSLLGRLHELQRMGCGDFVIDLSGTGLASKRGQAVMTAAQADQTLDDTTCLNFARGLS